MPLVLLLTPVKSIQLAFGVLGSMFLPLLCLTLLVLNNRADWVGEAFRSRWFSNTVLGVALLLFGWLGAQEARDLLAGWR